MIVSIVLPVILAFVLPVVSVLLAFVPPVVFLVVLLAV